MKDLKDILSHFSLAGKILEIKPLGAGLINDSYKVTTVATDTPDYVLQRINHSIFKDVDMLQNNFLPSHDSYPPQIRNQRRNRYRPQGFDLNTDNRW